MTGIERHPKLEAVLAAAISMIAPVALLCHQSGMAYAPPGWLDNYAPVAVALNYTDPTFWDGYYKISRMPWNMVEFVYRNLFSVEAPAQRFTFQCSLKTEVLSFIVGKRLFGRFAGLIPCRCRQCPAVPDCFRLDRGPDYQTSFAALMLLGFIASVTFYRPDHEKLPAFVAGVALMNAVLTISNYLQMAPLVLAITIAVLVSRKSTAKSTAIVFAPSVSLALRQTLSLGFCQRGFWKAVRFFHPRIQSCFRNADQPSKGCLVGPPLQARIFVFTTIRISSRGLRQSPCSTQLLSFCGTKLVQASCLWPCMAIFVRNLDLDILAGLPPSHHAPASVFVTTPFSPCGTFHDSGVIPQSG